MVNPLKRRSLHHKLLCATVQSIANSIFAHWAKTRVQKPVASNRQTKHTHLHKNRVFYFIGISASLKHGSSTNRIAYAFVPLLIQFMHFLVSTITVFWYFHSILSPFFLFRCRTFMLTCTCFVSFPYPMSL